MSGFAFPAGVLAQAAPFETRQALLLVDLQNDFVQPDGKLYVENTAPFLPKLLSLVSKFRSRGDVYWIRTEFQRSRSLLSPTTRSYSLILKDHFPSHDGDAPKAQAEPVAISSDESQPPSTRAFNPPAARHSPNPEAFLTKSDAADDEQCCLPGTNGSQLPEQLAAAVDKHVDVELVKSTYSAFDGTLLLQDLRTSMVTKVYICGSLSNVSVYATVLDAVAHGIGVTLIEDCLGYRDESCHVEAMRQMADFMCAEGIDYQELMDDLAGLLGDVVHEEDFPTRFEVSIPNPGSSTKGRPPQPRPQSSLESENVHKLLESAMSSHESLSKSESSSHQSLRQGTPETSPPRKRSTTNLQFEEPQHKATHKPSQRRASHGTYSTSGDSPKPKSNRVRVRNSKRRKAREGTALMDAPIAEDPRPPRPVLHSQSTGDIPVVKKTSLDATDPAVSSTVDSFMDSKGNAPRRKKSTQASVDPLGPHDNIGEGDSSIVYDLLPPEEAVDVFDALKNEVKWQKMFHRTGEVPRLVAVQGSVQTSPASNTDNLTTPANIIPIYRHPADESPKLLHFTKTVNLIRGHAEKIVGHPLNHVLIQLYRSGDDNISEHSDKTLDIARGSKIVNYSCGAMRKMTLRLKKSAARAAPASTDPVPDAFEADAEADADVDDPVIRPTQRIPLPHNSLFVLGLQTNTHWLHSIRADKRPETQKSPEELAHSVERISLTFRHIATFIDTENQTIWGQGATTKSAKEGKKILSGEEAERNGEAEKMIRAFGQENHLSREWCWESWYGAGFNVVNFTETRKEEATG